MGNFGSALGGVNTPETQQADYDLALGRIVEAVAYSRYHIQSSPSNRKAPGAIGSDHAASRARPHAGCARVPSS
jgi:hypothetical protein